MILRNSSFLSSPYSSFLKPEISLRTTSINRTLSRGSSGGSGSAAEVDPLALPTSDKSYQRKKKRRRGLSKPQKIHFVHVRFNQIIAQITYEGRPFPFTGLTIKLEKAEYDSLEGNWRGLFKKYRLFLLSLKLLNNNMK